MTGVRIPPLHPRAESIRIREKLIECYHEGAVAVAGLIAHGRGEAFDYLLGERTTAPALRATEAAAALLLTARKPVISVNGNVAALAAEDVVRLAKVTGAGIEVNLFYRSMDREQAIKNLLLKAGARVVLGVGDDASAKIPELGSERRRADPHGILAADVVLVPLEDGDRTEALARMGKKVIAIDLNPLSRTAQQAAITIVDHIIRAAPKLTELAEGLKRQDMENCKRAVQGFDNRRNLAESIALINKRLAMLVSENRGMTLEDDKLGL
jgi:4-phosphopantoate--beta-alanine ligase